MQENEELMNLCNNGVINNHHAGPTALANSTSPNLERGKKQIIYFTS
jgi:hypothetical protein